MIVLLWKVLKLFFEHKEKVPLQQISGSEFSILIPFIFHVIKERQNKGISYGCSQLYWKFCVEYKKYIAFRKTL